MSLLKALMPAIAAVSSAQAAPPAVVAPPAINDPMLKFEQQLMFQPQVPPDVNAPPPPAAIPKQISKSYSPDPEYQKRIDEAVKKIPFIKQKDFPIRDQANQFAIDNKIDPELFLAQVLHETSGLKRYPSLNPGGVKPSGKTIEFINSQPDDSRDQVARKLTQVQGTRENLTSNVKDLKSYFSHPDSKFETPKKEQDIRNITNEQLAGLNEKLTAARKTKDWQSLADEVERLKQVFPDGKNKNRFFWVTQPFMKYENREDGFRDMLRAREGQKDQSTWNIDASGNINRLDDKGKPMGSYRGTK